VNEKSGLKPLNVAHEIAKLSTPYQIKRGISNAKNRGNSERLTHIEQETKNQIRLRRQIIKGLEKEIVELEELL